MNKLLFNWSILTVSNLIYQILIFAVLLRIAKILEPLQFGFFTIIITAVTIAQIFTSLGLQKVVTREIARKPNTVSKIAKKTLFPTFFAFIVSTICLLIYLFKIETISSLEILIFSSILLFALTLWNYVEPLAFGIQEMNISAYLNIVGAVALFLIIYFLPTEDFNYRIAFIVYSSVFFIRSFLYLLIEWRKKYFSQQFPENFSISTKALLKKSLPFYWNLLLGIPTVQLPILFLSQFSGQTEVGYYSIGNKLAMPLNLIASNLFIAIFPVLSRLFINDENLFREITKEIFEVLVICGTVITLAMGLASREIVVLLLGENYSPSIPIFALQIWAAFVLILLSYISVILSSTDNENLLAKLSVFNAVLIGIVCLVGANYGALGLAISTWVGMLVGFIFHWYFIKIKIRIKLDPSFLHMLYVFIILSIITYSFKDIKMVYRVGLFIAISSVVLFFYKDLLISNIKKLYLNKGFHG